MSQGIYIDTSAVLRATLEKGTTPDLDKRLAAADDLMTSRLTLVESCRHRRGVGRLGYRAAAGALQPAAR